MSVKKLVQRRASALSHCQNYKHTTPLCLKRTVIASASASDKSCCQYLFGASQKSEYTPAPLFDALALDPVEVLVAREADALNLFKKSEKDFCKSAGAWG